MPQNDLWVCKKDGCTQNGRVGANFRFSYDIQVSLSDLTGTITNVRLASNVSQKILDSVTPKEFLQLDESRIVDLKWKVLLERWNLLLKVKLKLCGLFFK